MKKSFVLFVVFILAITACSMLPGNSPEPTADIQAAIAQTIEVQNAIASAVVQTQMAGQPTATLAVIPANPIPPSAEKSTPVPATAEPAVSEVKVTAITNANCRSGPAANFGLIGKLVQGDSAVVIGKNTDFGKWWKVRLADNNECWIVEDAITITGDTNSIVAIQSPKTPTPNAGPDWNGTWTIWMSGDGGNTSLTVMTAKMTQVGNKLTFNYTAWGVTFYFTGTVSDDGMTVNGSEYGEGAGYTGDAWFVRNPSNLNQFRGKWYVNGDRSLDGAYCGAKNGAPMPDPCRP